MRPLNFLALSLGIVAASTAIADDQLMADRVKALQPQASVSSIRPTPVPGLYEIKSENFAPVYMTGDGQYMLSGPLLKLEPNGRVINMTDADEQRERAAVFATMPAADQIVFAPKTAKKKIYVFTDVDCGFCQKLHRQISEILDAGVEVHYLAYPRGGTDSETAQKMQSVWCSKDKKSALTAVKAGGSIDKAACSSPVAAQYALGQRFNVRGTPTLFDENGQLMGGYMTVPQIKKALGL